MENVRRYYGDNPAALARYEEIEKSGKCPFCHPNITNKLVIETGYWYVVENSFPYKDARLHLLVLPKRHIISLSEMNPGEWVDMGGVVALACREFPDFTSGYGLALRAKEVGGVTLYHLHWHLIFPEVGENGPIPVKFGIG